MRHKLYEYIKTISIIRKRSQLSIAHFENMCHRENTCEMRKREIISEMRKTEITSEMSDKESFEMKEKQTEKFCFYCNNNLLYHPNDNCSTINMFIICDICYKLLLDEFINLFKLDNHMKSHLGDKDFSLEHRTNINKINNIIKNIKQLSDDEYYKYINEFNKELSLQEYCNLLYTYYIKEEIIILNENTKNSIFKNEVQPKNSDDIQRNENLDVVQNFSKKEVFESFDLDTFRQWLTEIIYYYNSNIYHNIFHAFDVLFTGIFIMNSFDIKITKKQKIIISFALFMHDIGHLGFVSSEILKRTTINDYIKFKIQQHLHINVKLEDHGINERMHTKITENLLSNYVNSEMILEIQRLILSTDLSLNTDYASYIESTKDFFMMIIKVSDLANAAKRFDIADKVGRNVTNEIKYNTCVTKCNRIGQCGRFSLTDSYVINENSIESLVDEKNKDKSENLSLTAKNESIIASAVTGKNESIMVSAVNEKSESLIASAVTGKSESIIASTVNEKSKKLIATTETKKDDNQSDNLTITANGKNSESDILLYEKCFHKRQLFYLNFCLQFFGQMRDIFGGFDMIPLINENIEKYTRRYKELENGC